MPIASTSVFGSLVPCLLSSDSEAVVLSGRDNFHARSALVVANDVVRISPVVTPHAHVAPSRISHALARTVRSFACCSAGRDDGKHRAAHRTRSLNSTRKCSVSPNNVKFVGQNFSSTPAVASVTTRHQVADVVVSAIVVEVVDTQITTPNPAMPNSPRHAFPAPVTRVCARTDSFVENFSVFAQQAVDARQRMSRSVDIFIPVFRSSSHNKGWYQ